MNFLAFPVMHWVVTFYFVFVVAVAVFGRATMGDEGERTCPLCAEEMDLTDRQLRPCKCGYEICVWCWHQIMDMAEKDDSEGRCPACRMPYDKEKIVGMADNCERMVAEINSERKLKSQKAKSKTSEGRKHLSSVRVIQRNLVYIIGIPVNLADEDTLERREFFGQYGKVLKVSISRLAGGSQHSSNSNTCSVYITYSKEEEAVRCIQSVHGFILEGRSLRACYGTTKYCHTWLRNMPCNNPDCLYLHDIGTQEDSFTKDEIISAYTRVLQIAGASNNSQRHSGNVLPPPSDEFCNSGAASSDKLMVKNVSNNPANQLKGSPPNSSSGRSSALPAGASWGLRVSNCRASDASTVNLHGTATQKADTFTGSSAFFSMVAGSAPTSALHAVGKTSAVIEETHTMHLNGRSRSLEYSKQCIGSICKTSEDKPAENVLDAAWATANSEDLPRQPSSTSSLDEVAHGCLSVDVTVLGLSSGLSSVDSDNIIGIEYPDISKQRSSLSGHLFPRSAGNAFSGSHQYSLEHGSDLIEPLTSLQLGKPASESKGTCVSRELSKWSTEFQAQGLPAGGSETDEVLIPVDQGFKPSEAFTHPLYLSNSCSPLKISNHSLQHIDNASTVHPVISDPRAEDGKVDEALLPLTTGGSALSNGLKENKFSTSASESNKFSDRSDAFSNIDKVGHLGGCNGDASKDDKTADVDLGENVIISNILSMDFDPWDDSLTCSLAELLSETDIPNGSLRSSSSRKPQNSSQSRFSFARQEDFANQATCLEHFSDTEYVQERYFSPQDSLQNRESYGDKHQNGFVAYSFEGSGNLFSSHSIPPNKVSVSRAQISVPPGFTVPSRAPPPGFSSQQRIDHAFDSTASSGNQLLGGSSILSNQYQCQSPPLPGNIGSAGDVEFIDPAILAVGKGRFPVAGISNLGLDSGSTFQQQLMMSENDTRIRLLMQPSKSSHQNFQYSDHVADILSPLSDAYTRSRLVEHQQSLSSSFTHHQFPQMSSLQQSRNGRVPNSLWDSWNDIQTGNDLAMAEIVRNERLGLDKYPGYDELRFHRSTSGDLYNRAFGM